jgi:CBS domain-containing protein
MREEGVGSVVIEEEGRPVGIVTDRDLAMAVLEPRADPTEVTAEEIMTEEPTVARHDEGVFEVTKRMFDAHVRRMPLVDDEGAVVGIITLDDFLVLFTDELNGLAGVVEAESPPY